MLHFSSFPFLYLGIKTHYCKFCLFFNTFLSLNLYLIFYSVVETCFHKHLLPTTYQNKRKNEFQALAVCFSFKKSANILNSNVKFSHMWQSRDNQGLNITFRPLIWLQTFCNFHSHCKHCCTLPHQSHLFPLMLGHNLCCFCGDLFFVFV